MRLAWIGVAVLSASWLLGSGFYHQPDMLAWAVAVGLGTLLLVIGLNSAGAAGRTPPRGVALASAVLLIPAIALAPWPHCVALILLAAGLAMAGLPSTGAWLKRIAAPLVAAGAILLAQSLAMIAYASFTARNQDLPAPLAWMLAEIAKLLGMDAAVDGPRVVLFAFRECQPLAATWGLLLDPATVCFLAGGLVLLALEAWSMLARGHRVGRFLLPAGGLLASVALWLPVRSGILMAVLLHRVLRTGYEDPLDVTAQFWSTWVHMALLAGPVLLAWRFARLAAQRDDAPRAAAAPRLPHWQPVAAAALALAAAAAFTASVTWDPAGQPKHGRVRIDDYHSQQPWPAKEFDTTRTTRPFDTTWYGPASAYNYATIYDYCTRFYSMSRQTAPLTQTDLDHVDVLILKVPSLAYSPQEIDVVRRFVDNGGGLMLIGEHTSVYGSGVNLNALARHFGFRFRYDCAFGVDSVFQEHYVPPVVPHPILQYVGPMDFATSCTIDPADTGDADAQGGRAVIQGAGLKNLGADYHANNYYPQPVDRPEMRYGAFVQLWATRYGNGRVVAFTDSTIFAGFAFSDPGKRQLWMGMIEWLNRTTVMFDPRWVLLVVGVMLLGSALALARPWESYWPLLLTAGACGWAAASVGVAAVGRAAIPEPATQRPLVRVNVDQTVCTAELPMDGFIAGKAEGYGIFERSILRVGYFTRRAQGADVFQDANMVVFPLPRKDPPPGFAEQLAAYVRDGGKVLVLDAPGWGTSTADSLLVPFGMTVKPPPPGRPQGLLAVPPGWPAPPVEAACTVEGGTPVVSLGGQTVAAFARHGKGSVWVVGFCSRFSDAQMGVTPDAIPSGDVLKTFELEYALLRRIIADRPAAPAPAAPGKKGAQTSPASTAPAEPAE